MSVAGDIGFEEPLLISEMMKALGCPPLTSREVEVAVLASRYRLPDKEIASRLGISSRTAEEHVRRLLGKASLSRADLIYFVAVSDQRQILQTVVDQTVDQIQQTVDRIRPLAERRCYQQLGDVNTGLIAAGYSVEDAAVIVINIVNAIVGGSLVPLPSGGNVREALKAA